MSGGASGLYDIISAVVVVAHSRGHVRTACVA
jgi:hypothetical protein